MSSGIEKNLVKLLDGIRDRSNARFKRFHPVNPDLGIYLDCNQVISFGHPSMMRLAGMKNIAIDRALGNTDPARMFLGQAQKLSGDLEHAVLKTARVISHRGINAARGAEVELLTGYGAIARLELTKADRFRLEQAQQNLPEIPVISAALQAIGRSMAKVNLILPTDDRNNILASDRKGNIIKGSAADTLLAGIGGLLLGSSEEASKEV